MNKRTQRSKYLFIGVFSLLCGILIAVFVYRYRVDHSDTLLRATSTNTAQSFQYHAQKVMPLDEAGKSFHPGYYDIEVTSGTVYVSGFMGAGQKFQNMLYARGNHLNFTGAGMIQLTPAKFKALQFHSGRAVLINTFGNYRVGQDIPAGKYRITWSTQAKSKANLLVSVLRDDQVKRSINLKERATGECQLTKGESLIIDPPVTMAVGPLRLIITKV